MKLQYFEQGVADGDDTILQTMIAEGAVPKTCLLGGIVVQRSREQGEDPCSICVGPRVVCGGRPRDDKLVSLGRIAPGDSAAARKLVREAQIRRILQLCAEKPRESAS